MEANFRKSNMNWYEHLPIFAHYGYDLGAVSNSNWLPLFRLDTLPPYTTKSFIKYPSKSS